MKICEELGIQDPFNDQYNKKQYKTIVKRACESKNSSELRAQIQTYKKKMSAIRDELEKGNSYFFSESLQNVRTLFRFRVELYESKMNFKNKPEYKAENYMCDSCETEIDHSSHVLFCHAYSELRQGKNLNNNSDICEYLQKVLEIRTNLRLQR